MTNLPMIALPSPYPEATLENLELDIMKLRTKLAFVGDQNYFLKTQLHSCI